MHRGSYATAKSQPLDAVPNDLLEPAVASRAADAVFLAYEVDQQRAHLVTLVAVADHRDPDADVEPVQLFFRPGDGGAEIVRGPRFEQLMRYLVRARIRKELGQGDDTRLADVSRIGAIEVTLQLVEAVRGEELNEVGGDVAQGASQDRGGPRAARWQGSNLLSAQG